MRDKTMRTKNTPGLIPCHSVCSVVNGRLSGMFCRWQDGRLPENSPAQSGSEISNLRIGEHYHRRGRREHRGGIFTVRIKNITGWFMGRWGNESMSKMQITLPQRHSKMSNLKIETENSLPQRHSKMSNGRLSGVSCWPHGGRLSGLFCRWQGGTVGSSKVLKFGSSKVGKQKRLMGRKHKTENSPAQGDSEIAKLGLGVLGILRSLGILGEKTKNETNLAQRYSIISILETSPAQRDSGISKLVFILSKINFQKILLKSVDRIKKNKYVSYH